MSDSKPLLSTRLKEFWRSWRLIFVVLPGVLAVSALLTKVTSPLGDAALAVLDSREKILVGILVEEKTGEGTCSVDSTEDESVKYALDDGRDLYALRASLDSGRFLKRKVRVQGTYHPATGVLDVKTIDPVD